MPAAPMGQESEWEPEPVWMLWSIENILASAGNQNPGLQPVAHSYTYWAILSAFKYTESGLIVAS
jgi:hypothetical protein